MAKRLQNQKRVSYQCPPKACPSPVDLRPYPELMNQVRREWEKRMAYCRRWKKAK